MREKKLHLEKKLKLLEDKLNCKEVKDEYKKILMLLTMK